MRMALSTPTSPRLPTTFPATMQWLDLLRDCISGFDLTPLPDNEVVTQHDMHDPNAGRNYKYKAYDEKAPCCRSALTCKTEAKYERRTRDKREPNARKEIERTQRKDRMASVSLVPKIAEVKEASQTVESPITGMDDDVAEKDYAAARLQAKQFARAEGKGVAEEDDPAARLEAEWFAQGEEMERCEPRAHEREMEIIYAEWEELEE
jgi:hypothetical protein